MNYTDKHIGQNSANEQLMFCILLYVKFTIKNMNNFWVQVNDAHAKVFRGKYVDIHNLLLYALKYD